MVFLFPEYLGSEGVVKVTARQGCCKWGLGLGKEEAPGSLLCGGVWAVNAVSCRHTRCPAAGQWNSHCAVAKPMFPVMQPLSMGVVCAGGRARRSLVEGDLQGPPLPALTCSHCSLTELTYGVVHP